MSIPPDKPLKTQLEQARRDAYRSHVLSAARTLFEDQGYRRITMTDIAQSVGVSKGTLYNYFTSKEALLAAMVTAAKESFYAALEEAPSAQADASQHASPSLDEDGWARLRAMVRAIIGFRVRNARMFAVYRDAVGCCDTDAQSSPKTYVEDAVVRRFCGCLETAASVGELRTDLPVEFMARTLMCTAMATANELPPDVDGADVAACAARLMSLFRYGAAQSGT